MGDEDKAIGQEPDSGGLWAFSWRDIEPLIFLRCNDEIGIILTSPAEWTNGHQSICSPDERL